ncbi:MarR family winged helix-turn-helix transcriptional regulator [Actinomadura roseirufa]|uniref:MarR family winged helix-turn-helix transcriptional regulator n=1 Tax=Actinomadura roseirufa TaxID=2094049 RepID=UPI001040F7E7|nr:MarR family transcriptional regulator [Actinomadura roseirufa]
MTHLEVAAEIRHGVLTLARRMRAGRPPGALSNNKILVLGHLHRRGPSTAGALAAAEGQRPQSLTRVFAELERDGLISRSRDALDGRQAVLAISPAGAAALRADMRERDAWLAGALGGLSATEREVLRLAARLMEQLGD